MSQSSEQKKAVEILFTDAGPFDEAEVAKAIQPYVIIHTNGHKIFLKEEKLNSSEKILAYGLAKKLLFHGDFIEEEDFTAKEVSQNTGMSKGTVDPTFMKLPKRTGLSIKHNQRVEVSHEEKRNKPSSRLTIV